MNFEQWIKKEFEESEWHEGWTRADMQKAWQASRESQDEYGKNEFCKAMRCKSLGLSGCKLVYERQCQFTALKFHRWLRENGYKIVKPQ